jgi:hypothetical protein
MSAYGTRWHPRQGPSRIEGPIRLFDNDFSPDTTPDSRLVIVFVVDLEAGYGSLIGERCIIAAIRSVAWERVEREVKIA